MVDKVTTLSVYISKDQMEKKLVDRLRRLSKKLDRSLNYLVVEAIMQFLDREEGK